MRSIYFLKSVILLSGFCVSILLSLPLKANVGFAISSGESLGVNGVIPYRMTMNWDFGPILFQKNTWGINTHWENAVAYWKGKPLPYRPNDDMYLVTTGPVWRWQRLEPYHNFFIPYIEVGISASWLSQREIGGRKLSLHFQFEDKIGLGFRFGEDQKFDVGYRFYHYSNASIKRPNSGVNFQMINFGIWFK